MHGLVKMLRPSAARGVRSRGLGMGSGLSARDMVVPLGRNPPPPEVLLQQGAQNDWMPAPDTIDPPSSDTMLALVAEQIGKLNGRASPGFDCVAASFIKNAVVIRPKPDGRGSERVNVLAPYIAQLFNLLYDKVCIPTCWKRSSALCIRKAPFWTPTITACWLSVAVGVVPTICMPILFARCLPSGVWQLVRSLTPNMVLNQAVSLCNLCSFFGTSTYNMLLEQLNPMGRLGCTLLLLILSKPMTPFQGMHYGNTLGVLACLRLCCL